MATNLKKLDVSAVVSKDAFSVDPAAVVADQEKNGRLFPHSAEDIAERVRSYEQLGQLQPVTVRQEAGRLLLVYGFLRHAAAVRFNELHPEAPMKLKCVLAEVNEEEAFLRNIAENEQHKAVSPMDRAFNQRRLRDGYGWADNRIAEFYGVHPSYVCQLKKLLQLDTTSQQMVHDGKLALAAAFALADLPPEQRAAVVAKATVADKGGKVKTDAVLASVRESQGEDDGADGSSGQDAPAPPVEGGAPAAQPDKPGKPVKAKLVPRKLAEVRAFFESLTGLEKPSVKRLAGLVMRFISGEIKTEKGMADQLDKLFPDEEKPDVD